jgi:hypothetical protein
LARGNTSIDAAVALFLQPPRRAGEVAAWVGLPRGYLFSEFLTQALLSIAAQLHFCGAIEDRLINSCALS